MGTTKPKMPQTEHDWLHGSRVLELAAITKLNAALPFAEPIALCESAAGGVWILPAGAFDPAAPTLRDLEGAIQIGTLTEPIRFTRPTPSERAAAILQAIADRHAA